MRRSPQPGRRASAYATVAPLKVSASLASAAMGAAEADLARARIASARRSSQLALLKEKEDQDIEAPGSDSGRLNMPW